MPVKHLVKSSRTVAKSIGKLATTDGYELSWEELQAIEKRRRDILKRGDSGFFRIVFCWDGTLLKILSTDRLMWLTMGIYIMIRVMARIGLPEVLNDIAGADIGVIGAFLSFFLVLYVNDSLAIFDELYKSSMSCEGRIFDVASVARSTLPRERGLRLVRYMNAAHIAGYVGLGETYTFRNFFNEINKINRLLTLEETERMREIDMDAGGSCFRELISWSLLEVRDAEEENLIGPRQAIQYRDLILRMRSSMAELYDQADQPLSFAYVHFICFLSFLYLPMFALSSGLDAGIGDAAYWVTDLVSGFIVFLQAVFVVGLRVLAERMSDPYSDHVDCLSVLHYINYTWKMSNRIMNSQKPKPVDADLEEKMSQEHVSIGRAFEEEGKSNGDGFEVKFELDENAYQSFEAK